MYVFEYYRKYLILTPWRKNQVIDFWWYKICKQRLHIFLFKQIVWLFEPILYIVIQHVEPSIHLFLRVNIFF